MLSVVIPTRSPWPAVEQCLAHLLPEARSIHAEVIVAAAYAPPPEARALEGASWLVTEGASVFDLRARGIAAARGEIVALSEDHCWVGAGFCRRVLEAHEREPAAGVIGGPVLPGPTEGVMDWANFLTTFARVVPESARMGPPGLPTISNLSFKRRVLPAGIARSGLLEGVLLMDLEARGLVAWDDDIRVQHVQSRSALGTLAAHFHNGRATGGFDAAMRTTLQRLADAALTLARAPEAVTRARTCLRKRPDLLPAGWRSLPLVAALSACHVVGHATGLVAGVGRSPWMLE